MNSLDGRFKLLERIGAGSFGVIYKAIDTKHNRLCALKMEPTSSIVPQIAYEFAVYKNLAGIDGIPVTYGFYSDSEFSFGTYNMMSMELLGPSLEELFTRCNRRFTVKTVCQIAVQTIQLVKQIHSHSYIHRDIKPENFLFHNGRVYAIDFGLVKRYRDPKTHVHILYREDRRLTGTPRYASINVHLGIQPSRRDDLESIAYMLLYFLRGSLPWMGMRARDKRQKYQKIMEKKLATPIDLLCKGYPPEFLKFLEYVRCLRFADKPDYDYLIDLFKGIGTRLGFVIDSVWDWDVLLETVPEEEEDAHSTGAEAGHVAVAVAPSSLAPQQETDS